MGTRPFAAAQTMKYPMKCTRQPHAAMNLHPYWPGQYAVPTRSSRNWGSSWTHLGANRCLSLRASYVRPADRSKCGHPLSHCRMR